MDHGFAAEGSGSDRSSEDHVESNVAEEASFAGCDSERALDALRAAVAAQKRGQSIPDLWAELFPECGSSSVAVNRVVREFSDTLAQGYPKLDVYNYQECIQRKVKEHEYLLYALHDGLCFTNRKINSRTYTYGSLLSLSGMEMSYRALFENAERLAAVQAVAPFLNNTFLENVIQQAGELIRSEWEEEMSVEVTSSIDRFFASVHESPQKLAHSISRRCHEVQRSREISSGQQQFEWLQGLFELAGEMFRAVRLKRHDLGVQYDRERVLADVPVANWLANSPFNEMWDSLIFASTQLLSRVAGVGFRDPMAKPLAMHCIGIAQQLCESISAMLQVESANGRFVWGLHQEDLIGSPDRYAAVIVDLCFGLDKSPKADEEVYKQLMILCKTGKCFNALFMLLYVCLDDTPQLYSIMSEWAPVDRRTIDRSFTHFVFEKWIQRGKLKDMNHLLKGPPELDQHLVDFLNSTGHNDLASIIQMRMGNMNGAKRTIASKADSADFQRDVSHLFLLSACTEDKYQTSRTYLQMKLNCICHRFNLFAIRAETMTVLRELLYIMHHSPNYTLIHSALDIFIYEHHGFHRRQSTEWMDMWRVFAGFMQLEGPSFESDPLYHGNQDFLIMQKACDKMRLEHDDRTTIFRAMEQILEERCSRSRSGAGIPDHVQQMMTAALFEPV